MRKIITLGVYGIVVLIAMAWVGTSALVYGQLPPSQGDWIVTGVTSVEGQSLALNGNLIVNAGGGLTLRNVSLEVCSSYELEFGIKVEPGGRLCIYDSEIGPGAAGHPFSFIVDGSGFEMKGSALTGCGWGPHVEDLGSDEEILSGDRGLTVKTSDSVIEENTFSDNHVGIILAGRGATMRDNVLASNTADNIYALRMEACVIDGNTLQPYTNGSPFIIRDCHNNTISNNVIVSGIHRGVITGFESSGNLIKNNDISGMGVGVSLFFVSDNNRVEGNRITTDELGAMIWGWNNRFEGNTIGSAAGETSVGIYMTYAYNTRIVSNIFSNLFWNGVWLRHCSNNFISGNVLTTLNPDAEANSFGVLLTNSCENNIIHNNTVDGFSQGFGLFYGSDDNILLGNAFSASGSEICVIDDSDGNAVYDNNFMDVVKSPYDDGANQWSHLARGNYWSDYGGADADGNGIGDTPRAIAPNGSDAHPLIAPADTATIVAPEIETASPPTVSGPLFSASITGEEVIENQTVNLQILEVAPGGSLTLRNVNLITGGSGGCSSISVADGATLIMENCTTSHLENGDGFQMCLGSGAVLQIKDSEIRTLGHEFWYGGLRIRGARVTIENSLVRNAIINFFETESGWISGSVLERNFCAVNLEGSNNIVIEDTIIRDCVDGVIRGTGSNNIIRRNAITGAWGVGILIWEGVGNLVSENRISGVKEEYAAIKAGRADSVVSDNIVSGGGVGIQTLERQTISGNRIANCSIGLDIGWNDSRIEGNDIADCAIGMRLSGNDHMVAGNTLSGCGEGLATENCADNLIYRNNFIGNGVQARQYNANNQWDDGTHGNYWSDYAGIDADGDGVGGAPYLFDENGRDDLPSMFPFPYVEADIKANGADGSALISTGESVFLND